MDLGQINRWRDLASKIATAFCVIALLVLVDGLLVHFREPANLVKVLPGASVDINGELTDEAHRVEDLTFVSDSDQLKVIFEAIHKGYFLGGDMWRGRLIVGPDISPGEYNLSVLPKRTDSPRKAPAFRILVFADAAQPPEEFHLAGPAVVRGSRPSPWRPAACRGFCWPSAPSICCPGGGKRSWPQPARPKSTR